MGKTLEFEIKYWYIEKAGKGTRLKLKWEANQPKSNYFDKDEMVQQEEYIEFKTIDQAIEHLKGLL